jgi:hypothetical protein
MSAVIPARFVFRWSWPVGRCDEIPSPSGQLLGLSERYRTTSLSAIDGAKEFAELRLAWNPGGIGLSVAVRGKQQPLICSPMAFSQSDGITIWLDTRATQNVHRATRYCHQFCCLPAGAGPKKDRPSATSVPLSRGDDRSSMAAKGASAVQVWSQILDDGYTLDIWLPGESLVGFDPDNHRQLGFSYLVRDAELGNQHLTVDRDFPIEYDPSLWQTLELRDAD